MSKARDLSNFISDATVDATEIADLAVTHAKLHTDMNLSSKTLTFAANQISGNAIDGGVISNFASTGIDDNATDTIITVQQNGMVGIGIDGPGARLTLGGTAGAADNSSVILIALGATQKTYFGTANAAGNIITGSSLGDTVLRSNAHNILFSVDSGSSSAVYIKSDGNVGIGTTSPEKKLHVHSGVSSDIVRFANDSGSFTLGKTAGLGSLDMASDANFRIRHGSTVSTTFKSDGKVGIGTSSPSQIFEVQKAAGDKLVYGSNPRLLLDTPTGINGLRVLGDTTPFEFKIDSGTYNGSAFSMGGTGDVSLLGVTTTSSDTFNDSPTFFFNSMRWNGSANSTHFQGAIKGHTRSQTNGDGYLGIGANASANHINIDASSGNVGIGTTDPSYKLDVGGVGAVQQRLKSSGDTGYTQGALVIESSDSSSNPGNRGQGVYYYNVPNQRTWYAGTLYNNGNKFGFGYRQVSGFQVDAADNLHAVMVIDGDSKEVGIGVTNPSATLHVEDDGTGGNSGHMKLGHTRTRTFYAGISSSENRWYKVLNYSGGNMFTGKIQLYSTRSGGFNQTGAHKEYRASLGGYSNSVYGPLSLSGDGGEGGYASLEVGTDAGLYLRVNSSIYGGTVYVTFSGQGGMSWAYSNSSYSTSLP